MARSTRRVPRDLYGSRQEPLSPSVPDMFRSQQIARSFGGPSTGRPDPDRLPISDRRSSIDSAADGRTATGAPRLPGLFEVLLAGFSTARAMFRSLWFLFLPPTISAVAAHLTGGPDHPVGFVLSVISVFAATLSLTAAGLLLKRGPGRLGLSAGDALAGELAEPTVPLAATALLLLGEAVRLGPTLLESLPAVPFVLVALTATALAPSEGLGPLGTLRRVTALLTRSPFLLASTLVAAYLAIGTMSALPMGVLVLFGVPVPLAAAIWLSIAGPLLSGVLFAAVQRLRLGDRALRTTQDRTAVSRLSRP